MADPYRTNAQRQEARDRLIEQRNIRGMKEALGMGRSMRCGWGDHAPSGCKNTGEQCLCICHDAKEE